MKKSSTTAPTQPLPFDPTQPLPLRRWFSTVITVATPTGYECVTGCRYLNSGLGYFQNEQGEYHVTQLSSGYKCHKNAFTSVARARAYILALCTLEGINWQQDMTTQLTLSMLLRIKAIEQEG